MPMVMFLTGLSLLMSIVRKRLSQQRRLLISGWIDGFTTALLGMHVGDHWQVFIPANLAYGSSVNSTIPAYSMLRFEMALTAYKRR